MSNYENFEFRRFTGKSECDKALNTLNGILLGIELDHIINNLELLELENWCSRHSELILRNPFMEFNKRIREGIEDASTRHDLVQDLIYLCNKFQESYIFYSAVTMDLQILQGIFHGIIADGIINDKEISQLDLWIDEHEHLSTYYPYDELHGIVKSVLEDGVIDDGERKRLLAYFNEFTTITNNEIAEKIRLEIMDVKISGICCVDPRIEMDGKAFCFTGKSKMGKKNEIQEKIIEQGGIWHETVKKNTDYLVVGSDGNPAWAFSCYGRKVEEAIKIQKDTKNPGEIMIIHEMDFGRFMNDYKVIS